MGIQNFLVSIAKKWADRRVARQAEVEDFPGVEEPKELPHTDRPAPKPAQNAPDKPTR